MAHILAVDDDEQVLISIQQLLENAGHTVTAAASGHEALDQLAHQHPELIVLDIIMPEMDGIEVCRRVRADPFLSRVPILFLTAKGRPDDIAQGLDAGGDDYLVKPFEVVELPARIRALLRRAPGGALDSDSEYLIAGDLKLHTTQTEIYVGDQLIPLTTIEHQLLHYLMLHAGQPVGVDHLLQAVWEYPPGTGNPKLVQVHIANLRAKIEPQPDAPRYLRNVRGRGYLVGE